MKQNRIFPYIITLALFLLVVPTSAQIAGIGINKSDNNSLTIWYEDGTVTVRGSYEIRDNPAAHQNFVLPSGKLATDIVGMSFSQADKAYAWFSDRTFSTGYTAYDLTSGRGGNYTLPPGKTPGDIAGMAMDGHDKVYTWYTDFTVSVGSASNLGAVHGPVSYSLPPGKSPNFILDMDMRANGLVYTWFADGTRLRGTYRDLEHDAQPVQEQQAANANYVTDPDGHRYTKIRMGDLTWTRENLNYKTNSGSWHYDNNAANGALYGRLYTWQAAAQACAALGAGWRLPTDAEWGTLRRYWGGENEAYADLMENGRSGFSARLAGTRYDSGSYYGLNIFANFWSASNQNAGNNMVWAYSFYSSNRTFVRHEVYKFGGLSCRCVHE